jgi:NADPH:quinone reductase-like Zn-dependent oxidoreductase
MKAGIITAAGKSPAYGDFREPVASEGKEVIFVRASALSQFSKSRSSGSHYSSEGVFPSVAGAEGVGQTPDGRRVYFALPEAPFGALAEKSLVRSKQCVAVPDGLDDRTAAAIANPGMSAWAGRLAVQLAKHLGAGKLIGTGRNEVELKELLSLGADVVIPLTLGASQYEEALTAQFSQGIDVVVDYLWGESARTAIVAIAKAAEDARPVRFVHVGGASREQNIELPGAALRSSAIQLMGSGLKSVPFSKLIEAISKVFEAVTPANLQIETKQVHLAEIENAWDSPGKPRIVVTIP